MHMMMFVLRKRRWPRLLVSWKCWLGDECGGGWGVRSEHDSLSHRSDMCARSRVHSMHITCTRPCNTLCGWLHVYCYVGSTVGGLAVYDCMHRDFLTMRYINSLLLYFTLHIRCVCTYGTIYIIIIIIIIANLTKNTIRRVIHTAPW